MIAYVLNENIDAQKLIRDIQNLINKTVTTTRSERGFLLKIEIKPISYDDNSAIPKLTYQDIEATKHESKEQ